MQPTHDGHRSPDQLAGTRCGDDVARAEASLAEAVEQLCGSEWSGDSKPARVAVQELSESARQVWLSEQEKQTRAMVDQIRKVRDLNRPGGGWWRRRRERRARGRLVDLMMAGGPELLNEAELRHWKSHALVELLLEFAGSAMGRDATR
ncbi:hypothetical protein OG909_10830 [Streptomyces sp. NBC_01754]|uniref:hypothetical protein n=1 Tax=Streptomyces sp. NBC_01754 TaxID=2975930 RepID=UPI002DDA06AD|nr:hypothetical protein [Streptomyces sp. NBC_01754]WSC92747.1 hypothetical protein OG909_10830 [Streptomyces sp. NBC_01754]